MYNELLDYMSWTHMTIVWLRVFGILSIIYLYSTKVKSNSKRSDVLLLWILAIFLIIRFGLTPSCLTIPSDRGNYSHWFLEQKYATSFYNSTGKDFGLPFVNYILGKFCDLDTYLVVISILYIGNYIYGVSRISRSNSYWLFLVVVLSFGYTAYAVNTMRAGLGVSLVVIALSYWKSTKKMIVFLCLSIVFHFSMIIPSVMILIARHYNRTRLFYYLWFLSIPLSFVAGGLFTSVFSSFSSDSRTSYLTTVNTSYNVGFRIDFIIYSLIPLIIGAFYIFKRGFRDNFYTLIYNSYILTNIFWILVIRANFSDRFAYLSWFMIPFILAYPLLQSNCPVRNPSSWYVTIVLGEIAFSFLV